MHNVLHDGRKCLSVACMLNYFWNEYEIFLASFVHEIMPKQPISHIHNALN